MIVKLNDNHVLDCIMLMNKSTNDNDYPFERNERMWVEHLCNIINKQYESPHYLAIGNYTKDNELRGFMLASTFKSYYNGEYVMDVKDCIVDHDYNAVVGHIGLIPSYITWTGWRAVGKTADEAAALWRHTKKLEEIGVFAAELEVVPDRVAQYLTENSSLVMLGMGAGKYADAQYLFTEDVCGYGKNHKPRHGKMYRNFAPEFERLQQERIAAFREFKADVDQGGYPEAGHSVAIADSEYDAFLAKLGA